MDDSINDEFPRDVLGEADFEKYKADLRDFIGIVENVDGHFAQCQQTFDNMMEASLDLAEKVGPKWKAELRVLVPALQSLQRRSRVMNSAIERFLKEV